jgi:hypothetical protein
MSWLNYSTALEPYGDYDVADLNLWGDPRDHYGGDPSPFGMVH